MEKLLYTRNMAADMLSISVDTLDNLCAAGEIPVLKIGSRSYFTPDALTAFVADLEIRGKINC